MQIKQNRITAFFHRLANAVANVFIRIVMHGTARPGIGRDRQDDFRLFGLSEINKCGNPRTCALIGIICRYALIRYCLTASKTLQVCRYR